VCEDIGGDEFQQTTPFSHFFSEMSHSPR